MAGALSAMIAAAFAGGGAPPVVSDPYFEYTTLLLPGNGTNGAQNNTFLDGSTNSFTITRNGNTTQGTFSPFSQTGWGNYFDGSGDYLSAPDNTKFDFSTPSGTTNDFTLEAWIYPVAFNTAAGIMGSYNDAAQTGYRFVLDSNGSLRVNIASFNFASAASTVLLNQWQHVVLTRTSNNVYIYHNGTQVASGTTSNAADAPSNFLIGRNAVDVNNWYFSGYISNVRVIKGTAVYTSNFTPPTAPLTAISGTSLLTCQSNRFIDNSTNNFTITPAGNTSVVAFSPFNPSASWSAATYGGSGYFDGSGDYLTAPANSAFAFGTGDMTFEAWAYYAGTQGTFSYVTDLRVSGSESTSRFYVYLNGTTLYLGFGSTDDINVATGISKDQWLHIAVVRSGSGSNNVAVFVNGTRTHQRTDTSNFSTNAIPTIGARYGNTDFITGYIGSYRIVKGTAVYDPSQSTITVPTAPLTAITNTSLLLNFTNAGIYDATSKNDLETVGNAQISTTQSKWGGSSMAFDGTGDWLVAYGSLGDLSNFGAGDFTIEAWVRFSDLSGTRALCGKWGGASNRGWFFYYEANNIYFAYSTTGSNAIDALGSWTPSINTWYYVAVTRSGANLKLYVDGSQKGTTHNISTSSIYASTTVFSVAQRGDNFGALSGYLQDLRITKGYARDVTVVPTAAFPTL